MQGAGCRVQGAWCMVQGVRCRVQGAGCRAQGAGCRAQGAGCRVQGAGTAARSPAKSETRHSTSIPGFHTCQFDIKKELNQDLSGNDVYYSASSLLVTLENSWSKLHRQKGFNSIPFQHENCVGVDSIAKRFLKHSL